MQGYTAYWLDVAEGLQNARWTAESMNPHVQYHGRKDISDGYFMSRPCLVERPKQTLYIHLGYSPGGSSAGIGAWDLRASPTQFYWFHIDSPLFRNKMREAPGPGERSGIVWLPWKEQILVYKMNAANKYDYELLDVPSVVSTATSADWTTHPFALTNAPGSSDYSIGPDANGWVNVHAHPELQCVILLAQSGKAKAFLC
jgi:hypothetical protein